MRTVMMRLTCCLPAAAVLLWPSPATGIRAAVPEHVSVPPAAVGAAPAPLDVLSFNIRYDNPDDGDDAWPNRINLVADLIAGRGAEIVGVQEALKHQIDDVQNRLPEYSWVGAGRDDGEEAGEYAPIFYDADRLALVVWGQFWCSETPEVPSTGWDAALPRVVVWATFEDVRTGAPLHAMNAHFDHVGAESRARCAELIRTQAGELRARIDAPVVLTGDFNTGPATAPIAVLTGEGAGERFAEARGVAAERLDGPAGTFTGFDPDADPQEPIDFVFVTPGFAVRRHQVVGDKPDGRFVSDHYPVYAEIVAAPLRTRAAD